MPWATTSCAGRPASAAPSKVSVPARTGRIPEITRSSVVLPAPLGPTTATASPRSTRRRTSHSAVKCAVAGGDRGELEQAHASTIFSPRYASITRGSSATSSGPTLGDLLAVIEHDHAVHDAHERGHDVLDPHDGDPSSPRTRRSISAASAISAGSRPPRLSSASSRRGPVASARASSSFFRPPAPSSVVEAAGSVGRPTSSRICAGATARLRLVGALGRPVVRGHRDVFQDRQLAERARDLERAGDPAVADRVRREAADLAVLEA